MEYGIYLLGRVSEGTSGLGGFGNERLGVVLGWRRSWLVRLSAMRF